MTRFTSWQTCAAIAIALAASRLAEAQRPINRPGPPPGWSAAGPRPGRGLGYYPGYLPYYPYGFGYGYGLGISIALGNPSRNSSPGAAYVVYTGPPFVAAAPNSMGRAVPPIYIESDGPPRTLPKLDVLPFPTSESDVTPLPPPKRLTDVNPPS